MEGLYLYCIREKTARTRAISVRGVDEKGEVFVIPFRDLEAVVSEVSLEEFASEEIQKKAQEDLRWIKEKAVAHEEVIEEAMRKDDKILSVIPMRFGTIFKEKASLKETLRKDYIRIKDVLDRIRGKQEWGVKVYLRHREKFELVIKEENQAIKEKEKEILSLPEGRAFFMEEELKEVISREVNRELNAMAETIFESLKKETVDAKKSQLLVRELTGKSELMVLNAAYLISEGQIDNFKEEAQDLNQNIQARGLYLEYSGPWPPFHFIS